MSKDNKQFNIKVSNRSKNRYGADEFSTFLVIAGIAVGILAAILDLTLLGMGAICLLIFALYRMTSTNYSARRKENRKYLEAKSNFTAKQAAKKAQAQSTSTTSSKASSSASAKKEISCPMCSGKMNIPTGKGSIRVTCPTCKHKFTTQS